VTIDREGLVSVMITVYNGSPYLAEAIESVLEQTYSPLELIVLDDGSTDGSGDIARRYGSALRYLTQPRGGMGAARNSAVQAARGGFFSFLDADDRFRRDKLERQMEVIESDPKIDMVFGHMTEFVSPELDGPARALLRQPVNDAPWRTPNLMLVRRRAFERVGPFSTSLRVGIGVDWYARAIESGLVEAVPPVVVLERRLHAANNGIRERDARNLYLHVLKRSLDRRRGQAGRASQRDVGNA
jgi:glycosyltransferase involved in cell wall biosynthesis